MTQPTKWVRLGDYIEQCTDVNSDNRFGINDAMGMTITKEIIPTKADLKGTDLSKFLVVAPKEFAYNPRTHGKKIGLGFNNTSKSFIISWNNTAFRVKDANSLYPDYLYMIISRDEWDRNACFRSWGSSTEVFSWTEFCLMEIPLPSIEVQRELVEVYNGLKLLAEQNEALLPRLSAACHAYIVDCRNKFPSVPLGDYIEEQNVRNASLELDDSRLYGVNSNGEFIPSIADKTNLDLSKYRIVRKNWFAYTLRIIIGSIARFKEETPCIVSSSYTVFSIAENAPFLVEFLEIFFRRSEFHRYTDVNSWGSSKVDFPISEMKRVQIPLPPIEVQQAIVDVYQCAERANKIATVARERLKNLCPALVQRAAHS